VGAVDGVDSFTAFNKMASGALLVGSAILEVGQPRGVAPTVLCGCVEQGGGPLNGLDCCVRVCRGGW